MLMFRFFVSSSRILSPGGAENIGQCEEFDADGSTAAAEAGFRPHAAGQRD